LLSSILNGAIETRLIWVHHGILVIGLGRLVRHREFHLFLLPDSLVTREEIIHALNALLVALIDEEVVLQVYVDVATGRAHILELVIQVLRLIQIAVLETSRRRRKLLLLELLSLLDSAPLKIELGLLLDLLLLLLGEHFFLAATDVENCARLLDVVHLVVFIHVGVGVEEHELGDRGHLGRPDAKDALLAGVAGLRRVSIALGGPRVALHKFAHGGVDGAHRVCTVLGEGQ